MKRESPQIIELIEYELLILDRGSIPESVGQKIYQNYDKEIEIEFPNFKTKYQWHLKSKGRVGNIPITPEFHIAIRPKVPINNLFGMIDYAYNLKIKFPQGSIQCQSLEQSYEKLANILAHKILENVNRAINNKHYELGISFFLTKTLVEDIQDIWQMEIEPYLEEYFFDNQAKMDEFLWDKIKDKLSKW